MKRLSAIQNIGALGEAPLRRFGVHLLARQQLAVAPCGAVDGVPLRHLSPCALMIDGIPRRAEDMPGAGGARP